MQVRNKVPGTSIRSEIGTSIRSEIVFRGDSGFAKPAIYRCCEDLGVEYVIGIGKNPVLLRESKAWMDEAKSAAAEAEDGKARVFGDFQYAAGTWKRERRIIAKAEHNALGANPRFVVTSLDDDPQVLYERLYCARGDMENRIKEQQLDLFADRTSSTKWWTNQLRLLYSTFAYILLDRLRAPSLPRRHRARPGLRRHHPAQAAHDRRHRAAQHPASRA